MKIGVRVMPSWFKDDSDLRLLQQIGVDCVDINLALLPSYKRENRVEADELAALIKHLARFDLVIERAANLGPLFQPIYLGLEDAEAATERVKQNISVLGEHGIPIMAVPPFSPHSLANHKSAAPRQEDEQKPPPFDVEYHGGYPTRRVRRGGYGHPRFELKDIAGGESQIEMLDRDLLWHRLISLYQAITPIAEDAELRLTMHGNDPPIAEAWGQPQLITRHADFQRLFDAVPSPANGMTYCVGTRYESGENVLEGIQHFGEQERIFHVHFRNVEGTLDRQQGYAETLLDDGDMNMGSVLDGLHHVGYQRAIDFDHILHLSGDGTNGRASVALAVGYIRGLMNKHLSQSKEAIPQ